jgi:hypothetical protein
LNGDEDDERWVKTVTMMATLFVASYGSYLVIKTGIAMNKLLLEVYSN